MTNNTVDEFIESLIAATVNGEVKWNKGDTAMHEWFEASYGNYDRLYTFHDETAGTDVVFVGYQYYEGEVEEDEFIRDGVSILLADLTAGEILNEVTDEDVGDESIFDRLIAAIEG